VSNDYGSRVIFIIRNARGAMRSKPGNAPGQIGRMLPAFRGRVSASAGADLRTGPLRTRNVIAYKRCVRRNGRPCPEKKVRGVPGLSFGRAIYPM